MYSLAMDAHAYGTRKESLYRLVDATGLVITVQGSDGPEEMTKAIFAAAPHLSGDRDLRTDGMILSTMAQYRVFWGVVGYPGGSLAILAPLSLYEAQDRRDWIRHFMHEVLDPVNALAGRGYRVAGGGNGTVSDSGFAQAFARAHA